MKDFSKKTLAILSKKGISIIGTQSVPAFEGDNYFSGTAYKLLYKETQFMRLYFQVITLASSSWDPETDLNNS